MDRTPQPQMTPREALDIAIASMSYRRAMRRADALGKRLGLKAKLGIQQDIARYDEAIRRVTAIRDLGVADEIQTVTVTVPIIRTETEDGETLEDLARKTANYRAPVTTHNPATCGQCAEA